MKGRAGACGHEHQALSEREGPIVGVSYVYTHSEQEKEEEKDTPAVVAKDNRAKTIAAKVVPIEGGGL